uniref:ribosomal protein S3 n=1 Tax=Hypnea musciformis TaxID=31429 RepID=UPI003001D997|nr:ribosomal protein S3 [Hypnea musciformis]
MAQKINPTSLRLGTTQLWVFNIQSYGKPFKTYFSLLQKYLQSVLFLRKVSESTGFCLNYQQWKVKRKDSIELNIYYTQSFFILNKNFIKFCVKLENTLNKIFLNEIKIYYYLVIPSFLSKNLLCSYSKFLVSENWVIKKVLWNLSKFLEAHLNSSKLIYTAQGIKIIKLKGFKIKLSGRIDDSKTQMAKSLNFSIGNSCLTSLQNYIVYSGNSLYSKSGICGIKIWLFYEFIY